MYRGTLPGIARELAANAAIRVEQQRGDPATVIQPVEAHDRTRNPLRPHTFAGIVGQEPAKALLHAALESAQRTGKPMEHVLLVGPSGTGKSTFSHVIAEALHVLVYELEAPVSFDTLLELRDIMRDGDILKVEEIHQQGIMERRGRSTATQPEVLYGIMEDRTMPTPTGILPFPAITLIGTTTDEGLLPDAFLNRFPLRPRLVPYTREQLWRIVVRNAGTLGLTVTRQGADVFAAACGGVPRVINNLVKNAALFGDRLDSKLARHVLDLNGITEDGLTADMQAMMRFLFLRARHTNARGEVTFQASISTIATAIGKSRDAKAIALRVEPWLIQQGYVQVTHGGRRLTDAGEERARELVHA